jgi:hypothetical protein
MKEVAVRRFSINPNQYELFRFIIERPTTLQVRMIATAPVNLLLLDSEQRAQYENGNRASHEYTVAWPRKSDLDQAVKVESGTWYLVVEGSTDSSEGRIWVSQ